MGKSEILFKTICIVILVVMVSSCGNNSSSSNSITTGTTKKSITPKSLGVVYHNLNAEEMNAIQTDNLFGTLKMGGIWVSALSYTSYIDEVDTFCAFAVSRNQKTMVQVPVALKNQMDDVLKHLKSINCNLEGISIDNETSRLPIELPDLFQSYTIEDYINDVNEIAPKIKAYLPDVYIIGLDLISFTVVEGEDPITDWLVPFCNDKASSNVDYVSIHYYAYNGAQKEWKNLELGSRIKGYFNSASPKIPANCPPVILGEFNTTFQYEADTTYPGSGGDSFIAALAVPEIFSIDRILALMHFSLIELPPSTLGMYDMATASFKPLYNSYKMLSAMENGQYATSTVNDDDIVVTAFSKNGKHIIYIGNYSPFFKRNITVSNSPSSVVYINSPEIMTGTTVSLAPFSLTQVEAAFGAQGIITNRFSYAYRDLKTGDFTATESSSEFCSVMADFSEPNLAGEYFIGPDWNQNNKIATGGSFGAIGAPAGVSVSLNEANNALNVDCAVSANVSSYMCGVELPFYADTADQQWKNWQNGYAQGFFRIRIETGSPTSFLFQLRDVNPEALDWDIHQVVQSVNVGLQDIDINVRDFQQVGWGTFKDISEILKQTTSLSIGSVSTNSINFKIHKVQICDKL